MELMQASRQWASRPADERFLSLDDMQSHFDVIHAQSREVVVSSRKIEAKPDTFTGNGYKDLVISGPNGHEYAPTNWAFGQIAALAEAPARYLRTLPAPIAADCVNYGLRFKRDIEDVGILLQRNGANILRAATGPRYGRIWNDQVVSELRKRFGDGVTGDFRVPGEFGKAVAVTKENTTLYAGDRDMFVFLADENNRIEIPNRRNGQPGSLAKGFFCWNSEVGDATLGVGTFLFDYACANRIVWGASGYTEVKLRHTVSAPDKFVEQVAPAIFAYSASSSKGIVEGIKEAQAARVENVAEFLGSRFGSKTVSAMMAVHGLEEGRPIESVWDAATAATAYARGVKWQNERVEIERKAGAMLERHGVNQAGLARL